MEIAKPQKIFDEKDLAEKTKAEKTTDGFKNFAASLGVSPLGNQWGGGPGGPGGSQPGQNLLEKGFYEANLITRNRLQLEYAYRGSWIAGKIVDTVAEDMTRAGIDISTSEQPDKIDDLKAKMSRLQIQNSICFGKKLGRLYGGAIGVLQIKGQKLDTPLDLDTVGEDQFKGIVCYDRWQINPILTKIINEGPDMGLPEFYEIVLGMNANDPGLAPGVQQTANASGRVVVHHTRCIRFIGIQLPFYQAITEMMWGESIMERLWDRLIMFDTTTAAIANLVNRAQLRTVSVDGLREILAAGGPAEDALIKQFEYMKLFQQNEGITLLDKLDEFQSTAYSFAGLDNVSIQQNQQLSGASDVPLVRLFGQSPAGMNATGEADIRMYYDMINAQQEASLRNPYEVILKVLWRSMYNEAAPEDLSFTFVPLWQMSAIDKANIAKMSTDSVISAKDAGIVDLQTSMRELRQASGDSGLFSSITDEQIDEAEEEEPPMPATELPEPGEAPKAEPGEAGGDPDNFAEKPKAKDSAFKRIKTWLGMKDGKQDKYSLKTLLTGEDAAPKMSDHQKKIREWLAKAESKDGDFKEGDHPRAENGKFGSGGGGKKESGKESGEKGNSEFESALKKQEEIESALTEAEKGMKEFPKTSSGGHSDEVRATQKYKEAKQKLDTAFKKLQNFNGPFVKKFKKELQEHREKKRKERFEKKD